MKVLVIGSGAKEHAITWAFSKSRRISALYAVPGNAGTEEIAENVPNVDPENPEEILALSRKLEINFVFCSTERAQAAGVVNRLTEEGFSVFGAPKESAQLETDRRFAEEFMSRHNIPTVESVFINTKDELERYLDKHPERTVLKKNGLGRNIRSFESQSREELWTFGEKVLETDTLVAEPYIEGYNLSILALVDGDHYLTLPPASDYTKAHDNAEGILTSGMGAVCPVPIVNHENYETLLKTIVEPTVAGLHSEGLLYKGVIFISLIVQGDSAKVTSYHIRFGDPEAQVALPLIETDFGNIMESIVNGKLDSQSICLSTDSAVGVVVAGDSYPCKEEMEMPVKIDEFHPQKDLQLFHGATYRKNGSKKIYTNGRRSFTVVGLGENIVKANSKAYKGVKKIQFQGAWTRNDIGNNFFDA